MLKKQSRLCVCLIVLAGLSVWNSVAKAGESDAAVTIAGPAWPVWDTVRAMNELDMLHGVSFQFRDYGDAIAMFKAKKADALFSTLYEYVAMCHDKEFAEETVVILVTDYSNGTDQIVSRPDIASIKDLKGKDVGVQADTLSLYLLHMALQKEGLTLADVNIKWAKVEQLDKVFEKNKSLSAVAGWNPCTAICVKAGGKIQATSKDFPGAIVDILIARKESLQKNRPIYIRFLSDWFAARSDAKVLKKMAELNKVSEEEFKGWLADTEPFDTPKAALDAIRLLAEPIRKIDLFFANNRANVPEDVRYMFVARGEKDKPIGVDDSLLNELAKASAQEPAKAPAQEPAKAPVKEPVKEPAKESAKEPVKEPVKE